MPSTVMFQPRSFIRDCHVVTSSVATPTPRSAKIADVGGASVALGCAPPPDVVDGAGVLGVADGLGDGATLGELDGAGGVGLTDGAAEEGAADGVGTATGVAAGDTVGVGEGATDGVVDAETVGAADGDTETVGADVGVPVEAPGAATFEVDPPPESAMPATTMATAAITPAMTTPRSWF